MEFRRSHTIRSGLVPTFTFVLALALSVSGLPAQDARENLEPAVEAFFAAARTGKLEAVSRAAAPLQKHPEAAAEMVAAGLSERSDPEIVLGLRALKVLGCPGDDGTTINGFLGHSNAEVRTEAVVVAGKVLGDSIVPRIVEATSDEAENVRRRAFDALLELDPRSPAVVKAALEGVFDADWWVSGTCLRILDAQRDAKVQDEIGKQLADDAKRLQAHNAAQVLTILAARWPRRAVPALIHGLRSDDDAVVKAALKVVENRRVRDALPDVRKIAESRKPLLASQAAHCLGVMRDRESLALLVDLLETARDHSTRDAAAVALRQISGRIYGFDVARWREYLQERQVAER